MNEEKETTFIDQVRVDLSGDGCKTVTGHVTLTRGLWHIWNPETGLIEDVSFCIEHRNPPSGLPLTDLTTAIGQPFSQLSP